jgi:hypothetical protein
MDKRFFSLAMIFLSLTIGFSSCDKDDDDNPCSGVNITVAGTVVNSDGANGSITVNATGSSGYTYSKDGGAYVSSNVFASLAPGTYNITVKDANGCTASQSFTVAATKTYNITRSTWRFSVARVSGIDVSSSLPSCQKDNTLQFVATGSGTGTGTLDEGPTKCNAGDPQTTPFTWNFLNNETQLFISATLFTGGSSTFNVVSITSTQLVVSQIISGQNVEVTFIH